jgi:hypothetical protein
LTSVTEETFLAGQGTMRLLNVHTKKLEEFFDLAIPRYAILSHRWGSKEVTFQDLNAFESQDWDPAAVDRHGPGLLKIMHTCSQALKDDLEWVWVDTCCIDKTSSAELSEAINSMFAWYFYSDVCYAYLDDVHGISDHDQAEFRNTKWFIRGWTLQELLAPSSLIFFGIDWKFLGHRRNLSELVSQSTNIPERIVKSPADMRAVSIAGKMSWAAGRRTTRVEDMAYSLLGIFNVNMPLLYGEGNRAFTRLQEEILRGSDDQSIFAWQWVGETHPPPFGAPWFSGPLADSPARFTKSADIVPLPSTAERQPYTMTNKGLRIEVDLTNDNPPVAILECHYDNDLSGLIGIPLVATGVPSVYMRGPGDVSLYRPHRGHLKTIYIVEHHPLFWTAHKICRLDSESMSSYGFRVAEVAPKHFPFNWKGQTLKMLRDDASSGGPGRYMAAFKFRNSQWDHEPVVLFRWTTSGDKGFLKIFRTQGERTLQQQLDKEAETTQFHSRHSMLLPPPRNSNNQNTTLYLNASVKKDIVFRREIFVLNVGISTDQT